MGVAQTAKADKSKKDTALSSLTPIKVIDLKITRKERNGRIYRKVSVAGIKFANTKYTPNKPIMCRLNTLIFEELIFGSTYFGNNMSRSKRETNNEMNIAPAMAIAV